MVVLKTTTSEKLVAPLIGLFVPGTVRNCDAVFAKRNTLCPDPPSAKSFGCWLATGCHAAVPATLSTQLLMDVPSAPERLSAVQRRAGKKFADEMPSALRAVL